jgi:hypothetical protein
MATVRARYLFQKNEPVVSLRATALFATACAGPLIWGLAIGEPTCDQARILHLVSSLLAGAAASIFFSGFVRFRVGQSRSPWSVSAGAGTAAFVLVYLMPMWNVTCPATAAPSNTVQNITVSGRVELAGEPTGGVTILFSDSGISVLTRPDGAFVVTGLPVRSSLRILVDYHHQLIPFDLVRPYGVRELRIVFDLATRTYRPTNT